MLRAERDNLNKGRERARGDNGEEEEELLWSCGAHVDQEVPAPPPPVELTGESV